MVDVEKGVVRCLHARQRYGDADEAVVLVRTRSIDLSIRVSRRMFVVWSCTYIVDDCGQDASVDIFSTEMR